MAIPNGLYRVGFQTQLGAGAGIAVLQDGVIRGGDSMMFYVGNYRIVNNSIFRAEIVTGAHTKVLGMASVFGRDVVHIKIEGQLSADRTIGHLKGIALENPAVNFSATLSKISEVDPG